ncbi:hypothetical protein Ais01nite_68260 [Asanoa ishikariensis]|uniref:Uncharacterized protein n=1 Tax=Asanoa ishikariensis TaxID=137265 RepID=A0A1H3N8L6_9ACTN|nr:hypothetical protein [Asanoa ishikariensis]GIF68791.1 hypothetical protein Ais01nite_68260 [Asanoa ishikariensis]SDY85124.1 hypothetical protein SAMN05421684_1904 [Asanoa ishikariensis]
MRRRFSVTDDSGLIALVDHHAYPTFVSNEWTYETLFGRFRSAMADRSLLVWGTGREDTWVVDVVVDDVSPRQGFRRVRGPIRVTVGQLHVASYDSLAMAAQFDDVRLPEPHCADRVLDLPTGMYGCEIVQLVDPDADHDRTEPDFILTLTTSQEIGPWRDPPWHEK